MRLWVRSSPWALLACHLFLISSASAQIPSGTIAGSVQDTAGAILVSAKVEVEPSDRRAATDNKGQFRIANLPAGDYTVKET